MLNETNHASRDCLLCRIGAVQLYVNPDQWLPTREPTFRCDNVDFESSNTGNVSVVSPCTAVSISERALQALRDVRHLLPADGVAIVDAVLDHVWS